MRKKPLDIGDWHPEKVAPTLVAPPASRKVPWKHGTRVFGVTGTILLHVVVFQSFVLGTRARKASAAEPPAIGVTAPVSDAVASETLVLLNVSGTSTLSKPIIEASSSIESLVKTNFPVLSGPGALPHVDIAPEDLDDANSNAAIDAGEAAGRLAMFGLYTGQIDARIARAWRRPRSPVHAESAPFSAELSRPMAGTFNCQVRILQDPHGRVQEVQMIACDASPVWQRSLVTAILSASPLPAPPNPNVFTSALTMTFVADEYSAGVSEDGYELEQPSLVRADQTQR